MAPDERDRSFDKALARHLRSAAPAGGAAGMPGAPASQSGACPDPETLAAYHERSLFPEQLNSLKEHIVGCADCQIVLAHLEMTDEIPLQAPEPEEVLTAGSQPALAARNFETISVAAAPSQRPAGAALPKKSRRVLLLRGARWQWLAPAGAIAAGLLVWIALHENQPLPLPRLDQVQVATKQAPPASPLSDSRALYEASPPPKAGLIKPPSSADEFSASSGRVNSSATRQSRMLGEAAVTPSAKSPGDKELRERKDGARDASPDQLTAANHADLDAKNLREGLRKKEDAPVQDAKVQAEIKQLQNSQNQNQANNYVPQKVAGPSPLNQMESSKKAKSVAAAAPSPSAPPQPEAVGGVASSYASSSSLELAREISNPRLISPLGSSVIWRAGRTGHLDLSRDGGSSWSPQTSGVLVDLLTGSAPSDQVCWIVGRVGAVLLTIDGGAHWKIIPSPLAEDLGGVRASDALHATIWNARSTKSFETNDGGLTWKPVPHP